MLPKNTTMELSTLRAFVKVVQTGSFTRAAEALDTQKAHISRVITQLEKSYGVRLLERTTRSLSLTEVGREFFERAVGILGAVDEAERSIQKAQGEPRGLLKLTCGVEFGMIAVSGWIADYLERFPQVRVDADYTSRVLDIIHEGFDLAIRVGPLADSSLAARKLGEIRYGLFASEAYVQRCGSLAHPEELAHHACLAFSGGSHQSSWTLGNDGARKHIDFEPRLKANNVFALRDAAIAGLGITLLPLVVAASPLRDATLIRVLPTWSPAPVPVHAVFASARYLTPKVKAFIDLAADRMRSFTGM
jgi:DNA-binding transcriptional LysR family regulator